MNVFQQRRRRETWRKYLAERRSVTDRSRFRGQVVIVIRAVDEGRGVFRVEVTNLCRSGRANTPRSVENVVLDERRRRYVWRDRDESALWFIVYDRVVHDIQIRPWIQGSPGINGLFSIRNDVVIRALRALLNHISDHIRSTAHRQVDLIASVAVFIRQAIIKNVIHVRPGLYQVPLMSIMRVTEPESEAIGVIDVHVVALPVTRAVVIEFRVLDQNISNVSFIRQN